MKNKLLDKYTPHQIGGSIPLNHHYFAGVRRQKGSGIFRTLTKYLFPLAKQYVFPHAKTAVKEIIADAIEGKEPLKKVIKRRSISAVKNMGRQVIGAQKGSGRRRKRIKRKPKCKRKKCTKKKKQRYRRIFQKKSVFD